MGSVRCVYATAEERRTAPGATDACPVSENGDTNEKRTRSDRRKVNRRAKKEREKAAADEDFAAALASGTEAK